MHYRIILNPAAGRGRGARAREPVERTLRAAGASFDLTVTTRSGEAAAIARQAADRGYDGIVAVGGDGTAHEVVRGLIDAAELSRGWAAGDPVGPLGPIPVGTGNDFAWRLGIPEDDPAQACRVLLAGRPRLLDVGQVVDEAGRAEIFHNHLGGGFEAATAIESLRIKRLRGLMLYLAAVLRVIPQYRRGRLTTVEADGRRQTRRLLLASVANGGRTGGGFKIAPDAQPDDGQLDLVLAHSPNVGVMLYLLPHFLAGTHVRKRRYVSLSRAARIVIETPDGIPVHLDGEIFRTDARRIRVSVLPRRLAVIAAVESATGLR
jgi:YegS/Rv2252/BmrU family lipid kinase